MIPVVKTKLPHIKASDITGVQPMSGPSGQIFHMKYKYLLSLEEITEYAVTLFGTDNVEFIKTETGVYYLTVNDLSVGYETRLKEDSDEEKNNLLTFSRQYKIKKYNEHRR